MKTAVRRLYLGIVGLALAASPAVAQDVPVPGQSPTPAPSNTPASPEILQSFQGKFSSLTQSFTVTAPWKLRWGSAAPINITVYSSDGKVVAGAGGTNSGTLYIPTAGTYYVGVVLIAPNNNAAPDQPQTKPSGLLGTLTGGGDNSNGGNSPSSNPRGPQRVFNVGGDWIIRITKGDQPAQYGQYDYGDYTVPDNAAGTAVASATTPAASTNAPSATPPGAPAAPVAKMSDEQSRAVVLIKGDNAEGTGFLVKGPDGPAVITNLHVIGNNPNIKITTATGTPVTWTSVKGASDRDLAMFLIKDTGFTFLDLAPNVGETTASGDDVITPGNSQGGGVLLSTNGKVLGIGPDRIEFDNPIYHGNSGGPVFLPKTNKVIGVVTMAVKVETNDALDKASFTSRNSAITGSMRYFGLRLDTVPNWIPLDWQRFQIETTFLDQFHKQTTALDSYLNPPSEAEQRRTQSNQRLYLDDKKIMTARDNFIKQAQGTDGAQRVQAVRELLYELGSIADTNVADIGDMNNFYPFNQDRAKMELAYRKALKSEIDSVSNDVSRLNGLSHSVSDN